MNKNIKTLISQQTLVGSYPSFKLKLRGPNQSLQKLYIEDDPNERRPQNLKVEYLRNNWSNLIQFLNLR
jgi:hypothetical protein